MSSSSNSPMTFRWLNELPFDNVLLRELPVDKNTENKVRVVRNAFFTRVTPTPLENVRLVAARFGFGCVCVCMCCV